MFWQENSSAESAKIISMKRTSEEQSIHDRVIAARAKEWQNYYPTYKIYANPDGEQNYSVGENQYPDIIILDEADEIVAIEEIETENSVTLEEGKQWRDYGQLGYILNLFVPVEKENRALEILKTTPNMTTNIRIRKYVIVEGKVVIL